MKNTIIYIFAVLLSCSLFTSCDDQYDDQLVAPPNGYEQEELQDPSFKVAVKQGVSPLVITEDQLEQSTAILTCSSLPSLLDAEAGLSYKIQISDIEDFSNAKEIAYTFPGQAGSDFSVGVKDLNDLILSFANNEDPHDVFIRVFAYVIVGGTKVQVVSGNMEMQITPFIPEPEFPLTLFMIGEDFGAWNWESEDIVEMIPVNGVEGAFWCINYFTANKGFKWAPKKEWADDFAELNEVIGYTVNSGNAIVDADGLYMVYIDMKEGKIAIESPQIYGMGDCFGSWDQGAHPFDMDGDKISKAVTGTGELRMYAGSSIATTDWWTREFIIIDGKIVYRGNGDDQERVTVGSGQVVTLDFKTGTGTIEGEAPEPVYPESLYMIGDDFGAWDWASDGIVEMVPVNSAEGAFWCVSYFTAGKGFKWAPEKVWSGDFSQKGEVIGYTVSDGNAIVDADGLYVVYIDLLNEKIAIEPAKIYGIGDAFGGWDEGKNEFTVDGTTLKTTVAAAGDLRMYAGSSIATTAWWTREFNIYDGKIVYRGTGGDQPGVPVEAGKTVTLDPKAGTGKIE